jgi:hypothetical protein
MLSNQISRSQWILVYSLPQIIMHVLSSVRSARSIRRRMTLSSLDICAVVELTSGQLESLPRWNSKPCARKPRSQPIILHSHSIPKKWLNLGRSEELDPALLRVVAQTSRFSDASVNFLRVTSKPSIMNQFIIRIKSQITVTIAITRNLTLFQVTLIAI